MATDEFAIKSGVFKADEKASLASSNISQMNIQGKKPPFILTVIVI